MQRSNEQRAIRASEDAEYQRQLDLLRKMEADKKAREADDERAIASMIKEYNDACTVQMNHMQRMMEHGRKLMEKKCRIVMTGSVDEVRKANMWLVAYMQNLTAPLPAFHDPEDVSEERVESPLQPVSVVQNESSAPEEIQPLEAQQQQRRPLSEDDDENGPEPMILDDGDDEPPSVFVHPVAQDHRPLNEKLAKETPVKEKRGREDAVDPVCIDIASDTGSENDDDDEDEEYNSLDARVDDENDDHVEDEDDGDEHADDDNDKEEVEYEKPVQIIDDAKAAAPVAAVVAIAVAVEPCEKERCEALIASFDAPPSLADMNQFFVACSHGGVHAVMQRNNWWNSTFGKAVAMVREGLGHSSSVATAFFERIVSATIRGSPPQVEIFAKDAMPIGKCKMCNVSPRRCCAYIEFEGSLERHVVGTKCMRLANALIAFFKLVRQMLNADRPLDAHDYRLLAKSVKKLLTAHKSKKSGAASFHGFQKNKRVKG